MASPARKDDSGFGSMVGTVCNRRWMRHRTLHVNCVALMRHLQELGAPGSSMFRRTTTHSTAATSGMPQPCKQMAASFQVRRIVSHYQRYWLSVRHMTIREEVIARPASRRVDGNV